MAQAETDNDRAARAALVERVKHDFTLHPPKNDEIGDIMGEIREAFRTLALRAANELPLGRDQALCITHLEDALMRAIASVARNQ